MSDLRIADDEFLHAEQFMIVYLDHLIDAGKAFQAAMEQVGVEAVKDGSDGIATSCHGFGARMGAIVADLTERRAALTGSAHSFIARIDELDQFIY